MDVYNRDERSTKVNLGIGVYQDDLAQTPVFDAVKQAEARILKRQATKTYVGVGGDMDLVQGVADLLFSGRDVGATGVQAIGGSGALRLLGEFCGQVAPDATIWVSDPTWGNHFALFAASGLACKSFPWKSFGRENLYNDAASGLDQAQVGDFIILHACCHNPTGIDMDKEETRKLVGLINDRGLVPIIDAAYVGFRDGFIADADALGALVAEFPVALVAFSASKNFALYRERLGVALITGHDHGKFDAWQSILLSAARCSYSMPPDHGAAVVKTILADDALRQSWLDELEAARLRVDGLRKRFAERLAQQQFRHSTDYIADGSGLFSLLPISGEQADSLREEHGIYMLRNGRINIAGLMENSLDDVVSAIAGLEILQA